MHNILMKAYLKETTTDKFLEGIIIPAVKNDMPLRKDGWQFNWKSLFKVDGALFFKLCLVQTPEHIEGMLMLTLINGEMMYMNNLEVAPHNYGSNGRFDRVAGCLLAFACWKSFELGRNNYLGFVAFDSKTNLIELYEKKYGATHAIGQKMFFDPVAGKNLMEAYLKVQ
ncbi:MAG: hypothetical protein KDC85_19180 [Saprospiraceae bacterium]|nr:hypothetical protein [Saprospiraceae bacterium]